MPCNEPQAHPSRCGCEREAAQTGPLCFCGLPQTKNPHIEAGVPSRILEVGSEYVCIPCLTKSRHEWSQRALSAEQALADQARQELAQSAGADADLDSRLIAAGMFSVSQLMAGTPIDAFRKHAGVNDLDTFSQWLDMKAKEYLTMQARMTLDKSEDDELYDWAFSHAAVFAEVRVNFKAATKPRNLH